jgi:hypothetical protein
MLTRVEVRTRRGTLLNLPLDDVENGLIINEIQGLDPVKATLVSSSFANQDGEQFHSSKREKRNIKLKMGLEPDYVLTTVKALRNRLYDFLMPQSEVTLRFYDDDGSYVDIVGTVESNDAPVFTKDPGADISIVCFNPDFFDPNPVTKTGMSTSDPGDTLSINYAGTVDAGFVFTIRPNRPITAFTLYNTPPDGTVRTLEFVGDLIADDVVTISTVPGAKGATLTRATEVSSILDSVSPESDWIRLQKGENKLWVSLTGAGVPYDIQYVTRLGGL